MLRKFLEESGIARKDFFIVFMLLFNVFTWLYMTVTMINSILSELNLTYAQNFIIWAAYYIGIIGSSIVGSILSNKISRFNFLYSWMILGAVTSLLPALLNNFTVLHLLIVNSLLGASFGLGMPSCLAYFAGCTIVENRGRVGGITFLIANLGTPLLVIPFEIFNLTVNSIILAMWRGTGLIIFFLKPEEKFSSKTKKSGSFASILRDKSFLFYFVAWFMFLLVDRFERSILAHFLSDSMPSLLNVMGIVEPIVGSLFMLIAGLLCDWTGRKRIVLYGFVALGLAYAIIGFAPSLVISWYFYFIVDGVAWGIFLVTFVLILWGDLSQLGTREKYYTIGSVPFFLSSLIPSLLAPSFIELISPYTAFSLASFFLFVAVLPLMYAPETLPEKKIELRHLRKYAEAAKKVKEKYAEKQQLEQHLR
jgi:MFS family permease